jgi:oligoendopeptidase F
VAPHYEALAARPLDDATVEAWLDDWSRLDALVGEAGTLAMIAYTGDTATRTRRRATCAGPPRSSRGLDEQGVRLARRLLGLGWSRPELETTLRRFRRDAEIFREANVPLFAELEELSAAYQKISGGLEVEWDGERKTVPQLQPYLKHPDRATRERAFRVAPRRTSGGGTSWRRCSTGCTCGACRWRRTPASRTSWSTASPRSTASTTRATTSSASTRRWRRRSRPRWSG